MAQFKLCSQATAVKGALCGGFWRACGPECGKKVENLLVEHSSKYDPTQEEHEVILSFGAKQTFQVFGEESGGGRGSRRGWLFFSPRTCRSSGSMSSSLRLRRPRTRRKLWCLSLIVMGRTL